MVIEKGDFDNIRHGDAYLDSARLLCIGCSGVANFSPREDVTLFGCVSFDKFCFCQKTEKFCLLDNL